MVGKREPRPAWRAQATTPATTTARTRLTYSSLTWYCPRHDVVGAQVEYPVGPEGCGRAVVQVEEPDGAIDQREPHCQQRVDRANGQAVERELQRLFRGLADLPADVGHSQSKEGGVEKAARRLQPCRQASVHATPRHRLRRRRGVPPPAPVHVPPRPVSRRRDSPRVAARRTCRNSRHRAGCRETSVQAYSMGAGPRTR